MSNHRDWLGAATIGWRRARPVLDAAGALRYPANVSTGDSKLDRETTPNGTAQSPARPPVTNSSSPSDKIALFRSLFRGREDVYHRRFESRKTGKAGCAPACANEGVRGVCEKPKVKCADCPHRRFLPVTDEVVRWHLSGRDDQGRDFVMDVYPMLLHETCRKLDRPVAVEWSRAGRRFRLNAELPIPFDNRGVMEVDFLCAEARPVIELDGSQHLGDAEAYRRDRRKDALLQQNRYFVLRFLAEDAGKQLDVVLDSILTALTHLSARRP